MNAAAEYIPAAETGTAIAEYSRTAAALADLHQRYAGVQFAVATTAGRDAAIKARGEVRGYRVSLEKMRKELKVPALERARLIDAEAKRITAALEALEEPIDAQIKAEDKRKEDARLAKAESLRVAAEALRGRLDEIRTAFVVCVGMSSSDIAGEMRKLEQLDFSDLPEEHVRTFAATRTVSLAQLGGLYADKLGAEQDAKRLEDERAELNRLREAQEAERARLDKIAEDERAELQSMASIIIDCAGKSGQWIADALSDLVGDPPIAPTPLVAVTYANTIAKLERMVEDANIEQERADAEVAANAERDRVAGIKRRVDAISFTSRLAVGQPAETIAALIGKVEQEQPAEFAEFAADAEAAIEATLIELRDMHTEVVTREAGDATFREQVAAEANRKAQAEADRRAAEALDQRQAAALACADVQRMIEGCTLLEAAQEALAFLDRHYSDSLAQKMLRAAIERAA